MWLTYRCVEKNVFIGDGCPCSSGMLGAFGRDSSLMVPWGCHFAALCKAHSARAEVGGLSNPPGPSDGLGGFRCGQSCCARPPGAGCCTCGYVQDPGLGEDQEGGPGESVPCTNPDQADVFTNSTRELEQETDWAGDIRNGGTGAPGQARALERWALMFFGVRSSHVDLRHIRIFDL